MYFLFPWEVVLIAKSVGISRKSQRALNKRASLGSRSAKTLTVFREYRPGLFTSAASNCAHNSAISGSEQVFALSLKFAPQSSEISPGLALSSSCGTANCTIRAIFLKPNLPWQDMSASIMTGSLGYASMWVATWSVKTSCKTARVLASACLSVNHGPSNLSNIPTALSPTSNAFYTASIQNPLSVLCIPMCYSTAGYFINGRLWGKLCHPQRPGFDHRFSYYIPAGPPPDSQPAPRKLNKQIDARTPACRRQLVLSIPMPVFRAVQR